MIEAGVVLEAVDGQAVVKMERHAACAECGVCHKFAHAPKDMVLNARNPVGAKPGDLVRLSVPDIGVVKASFMAYGLPTLAGVAGGVLGWTGGATVGLPAEGTAAIAGIGGLVLGFWFVSNYDRRLRAGWRGPEILKVLESGEDEGGGNGHIA